MCIRDRGGHRVRRWLDSNAAVRGHGLCLGFLLDHRGRVALRSRGAGGENSGAGRRHDLRRA
eukprot:6400552-Alexandrium_andersonii.AAC.1